MSGILTLVHLDGAPVDREVLRHLTGLLAFRGPDGQETWAEGPIGLGHALLGGSDEEPPDRQPCSLDGEVWITADARLDAREDLLRRLGCTAPSRRTDAALILEAYRAWGEGCVENLRGDFAFAIWDGRFRRLFCARDHFGVKPFFYAATSGVLLAGNTLACLRAHPAVSARLNERAIGDFLLIGSNQDPGTTLFHDVRRLPPAHTLTWSAGNLRLRRYWSLPTDQQIEKCRPADRLEHFREVLRQAVGDRLRSRRVGVFMSGGLDSTAVAAVARQVLAAQPAAFDLRAYTVVYDHLIPDQERYYSTLAARGLGIPSHHLAADGYRPFDGWEGWHTPEPSDEPLAGSSLDLLKQAQRHCRVVLTGQGGDALFHCTPLYLVDLLRRGRWGRWLAEVAGHLLGRGKLPPLGLRTWWRKWRGHQAYRPDFPDWIAPAFARRIGLQERWEELLCVPAERHPSHPVAHRLLESPYWTTQFEGYDPGMTGIPVEFRHPFFDLRLVDCVLALPPLPWCVDKDVLRRAVRGVLPEPVRRRRKAPLAGSPLRQHLRRGTWQPGLFSARSAAGEYVNMNRVVAALQRGARCDDVDVAAAVRPLCLDHWLDPLARPHFSYPTTELYHAPV